MAFKTSGANIVRKSSTRASGVAAYAEATNEFVLLGRSVEVQDVSIKKTSVVSGTDLSKTNLGGPAITSLVITDSSYNALDDTAVLPAGGYAKVIGTGFQSGAVIYLNGSALTTTFISSTELRIVIPATSLGTYSLMLFNPDNTGAIYLNLVTSEAPSWITNAGNVAAYIETTNISANVRANTANNDSITYSLVSGSLPSGATLYANGLIAGTAPAEANSTTYSFVINANDTQNQNVTRSFSMTINTDVVTWSSPADGTIYTIANSTAISNVTLAATNLAGGNIVYTANTLPGGVSLTNNVLFGTPANAYATSTLLTANATTTGRTSTRTIHWSIQLPGDEFFKYVTTLLSASNSANTFVKDSSITSANVVISGDTKPFNFNPYTPGYYSNYFDGTGDFLSTPTGPAAFDFSSTKDLTFECWVNLTTSGLYCLFDIQECQPFRFIYNSGTFQWQATSSGGTILSYAYTLTPGRWYHVAFVRSADTLYLFVDGALLTTASYTSNWVASATGAVRVGCNRGDTWFVNGYMSSVRLVKGTALYTSAFTPSISPLTAVSGTSLLTCQSNRFLDTSSNNFTITNNGDTKVSSITPYTPSSSYSTYGSTYFDGTGDYLSWSGTSIAGDFTAEAWVYPTANDASGYCVLYGSSAANNQLYYNASTGAVGLVLNATTVISATGAAVKLNAWNHIAFVRSGSTCTIYVNGASAATGTNSSTFNLGFLGTYAYTSFGYEVNGYVTDARIVNGTAVYTGAFTPPTSPLTAVTNTVLLTCQGNQPVANNTFLDNSTNNSSITRSGNTTQGNFSPYGEGWSISNDATGFIYGGTQTTWGLGAFTLEGWFNFNSFTASTYIMGFGTNAGGQTPYLDVSITGTGTAITVELYSTVTSQWIFNAPFTFNKGQWYHIAAVSNGTTVTVYVDGQSKTTTLQQGTFPGTYNPSMNPWAGGILYGSGGTRTDGLNGYFSNCRYVIGTAVYTSNFTPSSTPLSAIPKTVFLSAQSNNLKDNSSNNATITKVGTAPSIQKFSPFAGTTLPTPYYSTYLNGSSDYLTTPSFSLTLATWTMEFWLYTTSTTQYQTFVHRGNGAAWGVTSIFDLYMSGTTTGTLVLLNGTGGTYLNGTTQINNGVWHHVAVTYDGTNYRLFVDGKLDAYQAGSAMSTASYLFYIGYDPRNARYTSGYISNFRFVDGSVVYPTGSTTTGSTIFTPPTTPLTAITNTSLLTCQSNTFIDNSTNNFTITAATTTVKPTTFNPFTVSYSTGQSYTPAVYGGSMYFDGTGDYLGVTVPSFGSGDFTIEGWTYNTGSVVNNGVFHLATSGFPSAITGLALAYFTTGGGWNLYYANGSQSNAGTNPVANTWYHFAVVRSGNSLKLYINGISTVSVTDSTNYSLTSMNIGGYYSTSYLMTGYISDFRIIRGQALYTSNFVPQNTPLQAVRNTTLLLNGTSDSISDASSMVNFETVGDTKVDNLGPYSGSYYSGYSTGASGVYLTAPSAAWTTLAGTFTVEFWINWLVAPGATSGSFMGVQSNGGWTLYADGTRISPNVYGTGNIFNSTFTQSSIVAGRWYHIAVTRNSSNLMTMWVDGVSVGSATTSTTYTQGAWAIFSPGNVGLLNGYISNHRVTNTCLYTTTFTPPTTPLTAVSGTSLLTCQSNRFIDNSTNNFTITVNGVTKVATQNPFRNNSDYSMYFDGTGDYLTTPASPNLAFALGDFTVELWALHLDSGAYSGYFWGNSSGFVLRRTNANKLEVSQDSVASILVSTATIPVGQWVHIAVTRSGTTFRLFINGTLDSSVTSSANFVSTGAATIGSISNTAGYYMNGYISDMRITKGVARYTTTFTPPTTPFLGK